ncbi:hypothetical protein Dtox_2413 [Desulfofarcimen acetoxidans DSM 771]|uniref:Uncharacterized protein n=2 Tax=Desulfofarcimen acetoxidans TaxID=58138 RepID=C8W0G9_DESAS|nr:hypothetical protein Dtox_2413 [Desulfofarcimen acetoxidans DSM 771]
MYSECCGMEEKVISLEQARWRKTGRDLRRKLGEFAEESQFIEESGKAQDYYFASLDEDLIDDDFTMERCFEWFIFDYRMKGDKTLSKVYSELPDISFHEKVLLADWINSRISLYEVIKVFPKKSLIIKDIVSGQNLHVRDASVATEVEVGNILLMRVLKVGQEYEFSTSGLALPAASKPFLIIKIHDDVQELYNKNKLQVPMAWEKYLHARSHIINSWVIDIGLYSGLPDNRGNSRDKEMNLNIFKLTEYDVDLLLKNIARYISFKSTESSGLNSDSRVMREKYQGKLIGKKAIKKAGSNLQKLNVHEGFQWEREIYSEVAEQLVEILHKQGYDPSQQEGAVRMWFDFCSKEKPVFRKASTWSVALVYAVARLGLDKGVHQNTLAKEYGVASSTISNNFRSLCRALDLVAFDRRYFTQDSPLIELKKVDPLLAEILENLRL